MKLFLAVCDLLNSDSRNDVEPLYKAQIPMSENKVQKKMFSPKKKADNEQLNCLPCIVRAVTSRNLEKYVFIGVGLGKRR